MITTLILFVSLGQAPIAPQRIINVKPLHDADTVKGDVVEEHSFGAQRFDIIWRDVTIRGEGYDTYEVDYTRARTVDYAHNEIELGKKARDELVKLAIDADWYVELSQTDSVWNRKQGKLWLKKKTGEWVLIADWAKQNGHLRTKN